MSSKATSSDHSCDACGKAFSTKWSLELHVPTVHLGEMRFDCDVSRKIFGNKGLEEPSASAEFAQGTSSTAVVSGGAQH